MPTSTEAFVPFLSAASTIAATLWVVTIALLTIVLSTTTVHRDLGTLSEKMSTVIGLGETLHMSEERQTALRTLSGQYRALWFTVEILPIPVYFQIALLLSLFALVPNINIQWLAIIPVLHVAAWSAFIALLSANQRRVTKSLESAGIPSETSETMPEAYALSRRVVAWELPLLILGVTLFLVSSPLALAACVLAAIIAGVAQTVRVSANMIIAPK